MDNAPTDSALTKQYLDSVKSAAKARNRDLYVFLGNDGKWQSTIHLSMVPYYQAYVIVKPSGRTMHIGPVND